MTDKSYDVVVLGGGLKEILIATLLSLKKRKVLLISSTSKYDTLERISETTTKEILDIFKGYERVQDIKGQEKDKVKNIFPEFLKQSNDFYRDFVDTRKVVEQTGLLKLLEIHHTKISGDVFRVQIKHRIPADADELLASTLMGILEKRRYIAFRDYCAEYRQDDPHTHKDFDALNNKDNTATALYEDFGFDPYGKEFCGQAVGHFSTERYESLRAYDLIRRVQLLHNNLAGNAISSFFLPLYRMNTKDSNGQGCSYTEAGQMEDLKRFAKLSNSEKFAVTIIEQNFDNVEVKVIPATDGTANVLFGDQTFSCQLVITHPSFVPELCECVGEVVRQPFLCKKFGDTYKYLCCHWRVPFRQMRKCKNKKSDMCVTFLNPELVLSRRPRDGEDPLYICMIETMDDSKEQEQDEKQEVEKKIEDALEWVHLKMDPVIYKRFDLMKAKLWKPKMDLHSKDTTEPNHFKNTKIIVTDCSEMSTPFELICGEASDIMKKIDEFQLIQNS